MKRRVFCFLFVCAPVFAASEKSARVETVEQLRELSAIATVSSLDLVLSADAKRASEILWDTFANKPDEARFGGVTTRDWRQKWDLMADALVKKAEAAGLDGENLRACMAHLDYGRTHETRGVPTGNAPLVPLPVNNGYSTATLPVAAYRARQGDRPCWILVCKWELDAPRETSLLLGHIRAWALDCETKRTVGYVTCD